MAKIKFQFWKDNIPMQITVSGFRVSEGFSWYKSDSEHGRSSGYANCPCCGTTTMIFIWSFCGSGKRCNGCNVLLTNGGAFIDNSELKDKVSVTHTHLVKKIV